MIMQGASPEYDHCVAISTQASLREMIAPGALVILSPLVFGVVLGKNATAGLLCGALVSGVQLAISMSNSGGAWDNAKKYIEAGGLGEGKGKKTPPHANAVIGDTVGDPLKDERPVPEHRHEALRHHVPGLRQRHQQLLERG